MKKSYVATLALFGVFVALILWNVVYEQKIRPKQTESEEKGKQIVNLSKDDIQELQFEKLKNPPPENETTPNPNPPAAEYQKFSFQKTGNDWNLLEPVKDAADTSAVTSLISSLTSTKQDRVIEEHPKDLDMFGLKNPLLKITAKKAGGAAAETVLVGANTPTGFNSYAKTGSSENIYRIPRSLRTSFDKTLKDLRKKDILSLTRADIAEIEIDSGKESLIVKRDEKAKDKDEWFLARNSIPADNNEWNKTLNSIVELKATEFPSEDPESLTPYGLQKPTFKVVLTKKDKKRITVLFGKNGDKTYAKLDERKNVYEVNKDILTKLEQPSSKYENSKLANFNRFDVKHFKLERGKEVLDFTKDDKGAWTVNANAAVKLDNGKVDGFLASLQDAKVSKYLPNENKGMKDPEYSILLFEKKDNAEKEKLRLQFGTHRGKDVLTERSDLDIPFLMKEEDYKKIHLGQKDFEAPENKNVEKKIPEKKDAEKKS